MDTKAILVGVGIFLVAFAVTLVVLKNRRVRLPREEENTVKSDGMGSYVGKSFAILTQEGWPLKYTVKEVDEENSMYIGYIQVAAPTNLEAMKFELSMETLHGFYQVTEISINVGQGGSKRTVSWAFNDWQVIPVDNRIVSVCQVSIDKAV